MAEVATTESASRRLELQAVIGFNGAVHVRLPLDNTGAGVLGRLRRRGAQRPLTAPGR